MLSLERRGRFDVYELFTAAVLVPLAAAGALATGAGATGLVLVLGLVVALLARDRDSLLQSECAIKLLWWWVPRSPLSWAGVMLLALATGTRSCTSNGRCSRSASIPTSCGARRSRSRCCSGLVLLGVAPFHFWAPICCKAPPRGSRRSPWSRSRCRRRVARCAAPRDRELQPGARAVADLLAIAAALSFAVGG